MIKYSLNFSTSMIEQLQTDARAWYQLKSVRSMLDNKIEQKCKDWGGMNVPKNNQKV